MALRVIAEQLSAGLVISLGEGDGLVLDNLGILEESVSALFTASSISNLDTREPSFDALDRSCGQGAVAAGRCDPVACLPFSARDDWSLDSDDGSHALPSSLSPELIFNLRWGIRRGGGRRFGVVISGLSKRTGELGIELSAVTVDAIAVGISHTRMIPS